MKSKFCWARSSPYLIKRWSFWVDLHFSTATIPLTRGRSLWTRRIGDNTKSDSPRDCNHGNNSTGITWFVGSFSTTPNTDSLSSLTTNFAHRRDSRCPVHYCSSTCHSTDVSDIIVFLHLHACDEFANVADNKSSVCWWGVVIEHASRGYSLAGLDFPPTSLNALHKRHPHSTVYGVCTYRQ